MTVKKPPSYLVDRIDIILDIRAKFEAARNNVSPFMSQSRCPVCGGKVIFQYRGPRDQRMWCDGPGCYVRIMA